MSNSRVQRGTVLFVAPELPHAPLTGAHTRPLSIVRALAHRYDVTVVGAAPAGADLSALRETGAEISSLPAAPYSRSDAGAALARLRQLATPVPFLSRSRFAAMADLVKQAVAETSPDVVHLFNMYSIWYADGRVPSVIDLPDVVSGLCAAAAAAEPWRYALARLQRRTSELAERRELARMAAVMTINREDSARLGALGIASTIVPLAIDAPPVASLRAGGAGTQPAAPLRLLFIGSFNHHPNRAAARFIQRELAPELGRSGLRAAVTIAGHAANLVRDGSVDPAIEYVEDAPDLAPLYERADVVLVPLAFGGGTKNKTIEALAWGKPVVGTPQAFTGVEAKPGDAFLQVPLSGPIMARAVARLAADAALRTRLGRAGREYVLGHHSQALVDERVLTLYEKVLAPRA